MSQSSLIGTKWKNKKTGIMSTVIRVEPWIVTVETSKNGKRSCRWISTDALGVIYDRVLPPALQLEN